MDKLNGSLLISLGKLIVTFFFNFRNQERIILSYRTSLTDFFNKKYSPKLNNPAINNAPTDNPANTNGEPIFSFIWRLSTICAMINVDGSRSPSLSAFWYWLTYPSSWLYFVLKSNLEFMIRRLVTMQTPKTLKKYVCISFFFFFF